MSSATDRKKGEDGTDVLLNHNYDGIQEYDNPMPTWWTMIFWATGVWAVIYVIGINFGYVPTYGEDLQAGVAELDDIRDAHRKATPQVPVDPAALAVAAKDAAQIEAGKGPFVEKCSPCHGAVGQGGIGPNLTDDNWLHGGELTAIYNVIKDGVPAKGMPPWGPLLTDAEIVSVTAHIRSLRGTNPPEAKAPQGELYDISKEADGAAPKAPDAPKDAPVKDPPADKKAPAPSK